MRTAATLLRFRAAAARCGEPVDQLSDAQLLAGLGRACAEGNIEPAALIAAGLERVGPEWADLIETAQASVADRLTETWSGRSMRDRIWTRLRDHLTKPL